MQFHHQASPESTAGKLPPATPTFVLRGHTSPLHSLHFYNKNSRLVSGDADGWVIVWCMTSKRAVASWKAHEGSVLGVQGVDLDEVGKGPEKRIFTSLMIDLRHGRDHKLLVWRLNASDEEIVGKSLPVDGNAQPEEGTEPWLLHSLAVNALNFCAFSMCILPRPRNLNEGPSPGGHGILLAVPNALNSGGIDIFQLPSEKRLCTIQPDPSHNTGMVMALELFISASNMDEISIISGYEDGSTMIHSCRASLDELAPHPAPRAEASSSWHWKKIYTNKPHSQPVLSLDVSPSPKRTYFLTSSADALIVKHPVPKLHTGRDFTAQQPESVPLKVLNTKHAGQQGLRIRSDEKIFVTAGWDNRIRVYSGKTMNELAVLKWHKEGCYAIAIATMYNSDDLVPELTHFQDETDKLAASQEPSESTSSESMVPRPGLENRSLAAIKQKRSMKAQLTHWIAAGSKDGKISLWDIY
ncbi:ASTRA complex subunit [Myotisia sp. PD_48]|nr:ASTRA complex subunit [Myotisia sp. PD_48]